MLFYIYIVISAAALPILDYFFGIFRTSASWWLTPVLFVGIFLCLVILHLAVVCLWILTIDAEKPYKHTKAFRKIINDTIPLLFKLVRVSVNAKGVDKITDDRKKLFICNHQHDFDPVIIYSVFPDADISFIGKKDILTEMPFIAKAMKGLNCLFIDRENDRAAAKTVIEATKYIKEDKQSVGLFPEGYTSLTCELLPFRNGSLKIAYRSDSDIAVCVLNNTRSIQKRMFLHHTDIEFRVLEVVKYEDYKDLSTAELGTALHGKMKAELEILKK